MTDPIDVPPSFPDPGAVRGKRVVVTGAGRGLGCLLAHAFSRAGASVALVARTEKDLKAVAEDLPGPGTVFLEVAWRFVKAVGVGETITGRVEILEVRDDKPICRIATTVRNAAGEDCLTGTATVYTMPLL